MIPVKRNEVYKIDHRTLGIIATNIMLAYM